MKRKPKRKKPLTADFGERLIKSLLTVFTDAYGLHANGATETELLIEHDIVAAASNHHPSIIQGHRKALRSAVIAVDQGVPLPEARAFLEKQLRTRLQKLLDEINNN
jgi:hypothetical protein